jgi:hypothetical protein
MSGLDFKPFYHRNLPHIQPPGATLFVTYRLADMAQGSLNSVTSVTSNGRSWQLAVMTVESRRTRIIESF